MYDLTLDALYTYVLTYYSCLRIINDNSYPFQYSVFTNWSAGSHALQLIQLIYQNLSRADTINSCLETVGPSSSGGDYPSIEWDNLDDAVAALSGELYSSN